MHTATSRLRTKRVHTAVSAITLILAAHAAAAVAPNSTESTALDEVVITGRYEFLSADTSGTTGLLLPIEKVPQSITLISEDFLKAADIKTLADIAEYTPGAMNAGNQEGFSTLIKLRGFTSGQAIDGLSVGVRGGMTYEPDYAILQRMEIVKGPSSVVFGTSSPGGIINFITKSATAETRDYLTFQYGSWNTSRFEGQIARPLDADGRVRMIALGIREDGDSFMNTMNRDKTILYTGIDASLGESVTASIHGGYEEHTRTSFDGTPVLADGTPAPLPRSFFIGSDDFELSSTVRHAEGGFTWKTSELFDITAKANYRRATTVGVVPYSFDLTPAGNIGLQFQTFSPQEQTDWGAGLMSTYRLDRLNLEDSFITLSAIYQKSRYAVQQGSRTFNGASSGTANVFDGEQAIEDYLHTAEQVAPIYIMTQADTLTLSAQSVIQPIQKLSILLGASYAEPGIDRVIEMARQNFDADGQISYRAGVTYEFLPGANAYVSYSESFSPQLRIDVNDNVLPPLAGEQHEAGIKYRTLQDRLLLTAAAFKITQANSAAFDQQVNGSDRYRPIGEVTHKGFEFQALGEITPQWQITAGFSHLDPKITKNANATLIGKTALFVPEDSVSFFSTYTLSRGALRGLSAGLGARHMGAQKTSYTGATKNLPSYTVADATVGYQKNDWTMQLNAHNIFDEIYYNNNYQTLFYGNTIGPPANVTFTVRRDF